MYYLFSFSAFRVAGFGQKVEKRGKATKYIVRLLMLTGDLDSRHIHRASQGWLEASETETSNSYIPTTGIELTLMV